MIYFRNERGIALVMVMLMSLIGLAIVSSLLFMLTLATKTSGSHGFYRTADEAALGGIEISTRYLDNRGWLNTVGWNPAPSIMRTETDPCFKEKLETLRGETWDDEDKDLFDWTSCKVADAAQMLAVLSMDADREPDLSFDLPNLLGGTYTVFTKIVDTVPGYQ